MSTQINPWPDTINFTNLELQTTSDDQPAPFPFIKTFEKTSKVISVDPHDEDDDEGEDPASRARNNAVSLIGEISTGAAAKDTAPEVTTASPGAIVFFESSMNNFYKNNGSERQYLGTVSCDVPSNPTTDVEVATLLASRMAAFGASGGGGAAAHTMAVYIKKRFTYRKYNAVFVGEVDDSGVVNGGAEAPSSSVVMNGGRTAAPDAAPGSNNSSPGKGAAGGGRSRRAQDRYTQAVAFEFVSNVMGNVIGEDGIMFQEQVAQMAEEEKQQQQQQ